MVKLLTAYLVAVWSGDDMTTAVTVRSAHRVADSAAGLQIGDIWTIDGLLWGTLLSSGNDASVALADAVGAEILTWEQDGGDTVARFIREMNAVAPTLGAKQSVFTTPSGNSDDDVSSARDMALIARAAFSHPALEKYWRTRVCQVPIGGPNARVTEFTSTHAMVGDDRIVGGKTGSGGSRPSASNLATAWRAPNGDMIVIVTFSTDNNLNNRYIDARAVISRLPLDFPELARAT